MAKFWTLCQRPREPKGDFDEDFEQNFRCGNLQCVRCAGASLRPGILCSSQTRSAFGPAGSSCCLGDRSVGFLVDYLQRCRDAYAHGPLQEGPGPCGRHELSEVRSEDHPYELRSLM